MSIWNCFRCILFVGLLLVLGCGGGETASEKGASKGRRAMVKIDGSSTVAPMSMVAAEMFQSDHPNVRVTVGISGTGGGFKKFLSDAADLRTDINDASRPIKASEMDRAKQLNVEFIELPIALDGIAVVVHPKNTFCDDLTVEELKHMWEPGSKITNWQQVRQGFPDLPLKLYGPGTDSGTFDYFTEAIVGKEKASRSDYTMSEDDNVLVQGVSGDPGGLGYFGFAYYHENQGKLRLLGIDNGKGTFIQPSLETIRNGTYRPLSRPLFLYVNAASANRPELADFVTFYLKHAAEIAQHPRVGYVALPEKMYPLLIGRFKKGVVGSTIAQVKHEPVTDLYRLYSSQP